MAEELKDERKDVVLDKCNLKVYRELGSGLAEVYVIRNPGEGEHKGILNFSTFLAADSHIDTGQYELILRPVKASSVAVQSNDQALKE